MLTDKLSGAKDDRPGLSRCLIRAKFPPAPFQSERINRNPCLWASLRQININEPAEKLAVMSAITP